MYYIGQKTWTPLFFWYSSCHTTHNKKLVNDPYESLTIINSSNDQYESLDDQEPFQTRILYCLNSFLEFRSLLFSLWFWHNFLNST